MKTLKDMRKEIVEVMTQLRNKEITASNAAQFFNGAGKVIANIKCEMEINKSLGKNNEDLKIF